MIPSQVWTNPEFMFGSWGDDTYAIVQIQTGGENIDAVDDSEKVQSAEPQTDDVINYLYSNYSNILTIYQILIF